MVFRNTGFLKLKNGRNVIRMENSTKQLAFVPYVLKETALIRCQARLIAAAHLRTDPFCLSGRSPTEDPEGQQAVHAAACAEQKVLQGV